MPASRHGLRYSNSKKKTGIEHFGLISKELSFALKEQPRKWPGSEEVGLSTLGLDQTRSLSQTWSITRAAKGGSSCSRESQRLSWVGMESRSTASPPVRSRSKEPASKLQTTRPPGQASRHWD